MSSSPIKQTVAGFIDKLKEAIEARSDAEKQIAEYTAAIRALAQVMEDKETADSVLATLDELGGGMGFAAATRWVLRVSPKALTPPAIRTLITIGKKMDLSRYSNPMASIHTTLRRMRESGEVEEVVNDKGEKAYRLTKKSGGIPPPPRAGQRIVSQPAPNSLAAMDADGRLTPPPEAPRTMRKKL
jgi:hypothetical protein